MILLLLKSVYVLTLYNDRYVSLISACRVCSDAGVSSHVLLQDSHDYQLAVSRFSVVYHDAGIALLKRNTFC